MVDDIPSPCTKVCKIDPASGRCIGCARTMDEIGRWQYLGAAVKQALLADLATRPKAIKPRRWPFSAG